MEFLKHLQGLRSRKCFNIKLQNWGERAASIILTLQCWNLRLASRQENSSRRQGLLTKEQPDKSVKHVWHSGSNNHSSGPAEVFLQKERIQQLIGTRLWTATHSSSQSLWNGHFFPYPLHTYDNSGWVPMRHDGCWSWSSSWWLLKLAMLPCPHTHLQPHSCWGSRTDTDNEDSWARQTLAILLPVTFSSLSTCTPTSPQEQQRHKDKRQQAALERRDHISSMLNSRGTALSGQEQHGKENWSHYFSW